MDKIKLIIQNKLKQIFDIEAGVNVDRPDVKFGDFSTNIAMQLAPSLKQSPHQIAETLISELNKDDTFESVSMAGPGFINLKLSDVYLKNELEDMVNNSENYAKSDQYKDKVVVTEYSDPNPFKVLHVGHLYTSIIGDAISNIIESAGGEVHRVNFGGDVGLHVAKTIWAIIQNLGGELPDKLPDIDDAKRSEWMAKCYVEGTRAYEDDENAKLEIININKQIYDIHKKDDHTSNISQIYWTCRQWSYDYFDAFYDRIGTKFERYYPESQTAEIGLRIVLEQKDKGVYQESDGAIIFDGDKYGLHTRVFINKQGLPTYEAKDVGLSLLKWQDYHFDQSVIITGNDIIEYMKVVLKSIEQFRPELANSTKHITHGNVKLAGGVKMASRKGNFLRAIDVIDMTAKISQDLRGDSDESLVLGAIKYAFLKNKIGADIIFEPQESISLQGNSGLYLQYALVRANSIINKSNNSDSDTSFENYEFNSSEHNLIIKLTEFRDTMQLVTSSLLPHHLCSYLYELAQEFNRFYESNRVVGDDNESVRINLVKAYANILKRGLDILGMPAPEKI